MKNYLHLYIDCSLIKRYYMIISILYKGKVTDYNHQHHKKCSNQIYIVDY